MGHFPYKFLQREGKVAIFICISALNSQKYKYKESRKD